MENFEINNFTFGYKAFLTEWVSVVKACTRFWTTIIWWNELFIMCLCVWLLAIWQPHMEFTKYSVCRNIVWFHKGMIVKISSYLFLFRIINILLKKNLTSKDSIKWWVSGSQTLDLSNQSCESIQTTVNVESYLYSVINNVLVKVSINISGSRIFIHIRCIVLELVNLM